MADSAIDGIFDLTKRYSGYDTKGTSSTTNTDYDPTVNYWGEKEKYDQLYEDKSTLSFTDMLGLMVTQFQNQTIDNQASTTDMMNQLVQMSSMQAMTEMTTQIKELTLANVMAYAASLVGQTVTVGVWNEETKEVEEIVGVVKGTGTYDGHWSWIYAFNDQVTTRIDTAKVASVADLTPENCTVTDVNLWQWMSQQSLPQAAE